MAHIGQKQAFAFAGGFGFLLRLAQLFIQGLECSSFTLLIPMAYQQADGGCHQQHQLNHGQPGDLLVLRQQFGVLLFQQHGGHEVGRTAYGMGAGGEINHILQKFTQGFCLVAVPVQNKLSPQHKSVHAFDRSNVVRVFKHEGRTR